MIFIEQPAGIHQPSVSPDDVQTSGTSGFLRKTCGRNVEGGSSLVEGAPNVERLIPDIDTLRGA